MHSLSCGRVIMHSFFLHWFLLLRGGGCRRRSEESLLAATTARRDMHHNHVRGVKKTSVRGDRAATFFIIERATYLHRPRQWQWSRSMRPSVVMEYHHAPTHGRTRASAAKNRAP